MVEIDPSVHSHGYSGTKVLKEAAPSLATILDTAIAERWDEFALQVKKAQTTPTVKAVHGLRVATRRLLAILDMLKTAIPKCGGAGTRKKLKSHLKSLSALRDTQVQVLRTRELAAGFEVLSSFLRELITREALEAKNVRKEISRIDLDSMGGYFGELRAKVNESLSGRAMDNATLTILRGLLAQLFVKATFIKRSIPVAPSELTSRCKKIHELRLLFKRLRYTIEILMPVHPGISVAILKRMSDYQTKMGAVQDTEVLISAISSQAKKVRKKDIRNGQPASGAFDRVISHLTDRIREESDAFLATVDEFDKFWKCFR